MVSREYTLLGHPTVVIRSSEMPNCLECNNDYEVFPSTIFCKKCGVRLLEVDPAAAKGRAAEYISGSLLWILALLPLGAGIALWVMGPMWFQETESNNVRNLGIVLTAGGGLSFVAGISLAIFANREVKPTDESAEGEETVDPANVPAETE